MLFDHVAGYALRLAFALLDLAHDRDALAGTIPRIRPPQAVVALARGPDEAFDCVGEGFEDRLELDHDLAAERGGDLRQGADRRVAAGALQLGDLLLRHPDARRERRLREPLLVA